MYTQISKINYGMERLWKYDELLVIIVQMKCSEVWRELFVLSTIYVIVIIMTGDNSTLQCTGFALSVPCDVRGVLRVGIFGSLPPEVTQ